MAAFSAAALLLSGCVNQNAHTAAAGEADELRIVATSPAVVDIMARLDIDLVGVPNSTLSEIPAAMMMLPGQGRPWGRIWK